MASASRSAVGILLLLLFALGSPAETAPASAAASYESALVDEINAVRLEHGLPALRAVRALSGVAERHSQRMVAKGFFSHAGFAARIRRAYPGGAAGENLAWRSPDLPPAEAVAMWLESPGHRANLLSRRWRHVGVGAASRERAPGHFKGLPVTVVTANFGARR